VDENNRECCICLEDNKLDGMVVRLPCAHIFHEACIHDWLLYHSCTCPVCRYELPTDDAGYEAGRKERMKLRKPRYAMHELKRMKVTDLLALHRLPQSGVIEKKDLIQDLIDNDWIDIIPSPEPVEYELEVLKNMKVRELKKTMEDAGVFFRREDVVEKSDMISVFENSGRLVLKTNSEPSDAAIAVDCKACDCFVGEAPEAYPSNGKEQGSADDAETAIDDKTGDCIMVETAEDDLSTADDGDGDGDGDADADDVAIALDDQTGDYIIVESGGDEFFNFDADGDSNETTDENRMGSPIVMFPDQDEEGDEENVEDPTSTETTETVTRNSIVENSSSAPIRAANEDSSNPVDSDSQNTRTAVVLAEQEPTEENGRIVDETSRLNQNESNSAVRSEVEPGRGGQNRSELNEPNVAATINLVDQGCDLRSTYDHYTINHLRTLAQDLQVDVSHCLQREEIIDLFLNAGITGSPDPEALLPAMFSSWSISELRSVGSAISIDLSQCATGGEMVDRILRVGNTERPYLRGYLRSLFPLTTTSLKDLRAIARELQIDISDCLEKDEIIRRLISRQRRQDST